MTSLASGARPRLRRDRAGGWIAGVCAGIARRFGADPALVRLAFVVATAAGGLGVALYALAWLVVPAGDAPPRERRGPSGARASVEVALGSGLLLLSALLTFRALGLWFSDAIVWPLVLIADRRRAHLAPVARQARLRSRRPAAPRARGARARRDGRARPRRGRAHARRLAVSRTASGVALVIAAGLAFLQATGALSAARDVLLAVFAVVVVLGVIFAPWILRLVRSLAAERAERIRSQERAEVAAHLHDSVLQTLAHGPAPRRRPARGGRARAPPGARAARVARRTAGSRPGGQPGRRARGSRRRGGGAATACRWRSWRSATRRSIRRRRRWWPRRARR